MNGAVCLIVPDGKRLKDLVVMAPERRGNRYLRASGELANIATAELFESPAP